MSEPRFRVEVEVPSEDCAVVTAAGEIDLETATEFHQALEKGIDTGARRVIVDLTAVSFIDSTALSVMVKGAKRLDARDAALDVVCPEGHVYRIIEITGLHEVLTIHPHRAAALQGCTPTAASTAPV
jgi:anti-anti-sigma factor